MLKKAEKEIALPKPHFFQKVKTNFASPERYVCNYLLSSSE